MTKTDAFLYQQIAESIRRLLASGELSPGDKLPSVREMARRWDCTPGTVSRAYAQLADEGLVTGQRGGGTRVMPNALQPERPTWQWANLINRAEQFLLEAIGSGHTPTQAQSALSVAVSRWQELQAKQPPMARPAASQETLRFAGSHDLTVEFLARLLSEESPQIRLDVEYVGSLGGLIALAQGQAQVAGSHLWDEVTDTYNAPFVRRLLPGRQVVLLTLTHRSLGLIIPPNNPQGLRGLPDLAWPQVRLVNRQPGSGTRVWLDAQLKAVGVEPASVPGYEREESTHLAVAHAVEGGEANVGLGIHAAAAAYGLGFVPLARERYDLVIPAELWGTPSIQALVALVRSLRFQEAVVALGGYDVSETGQEHWIA